MLSKRSSLCCSCSVKQPHSQINLEDVVDQKILVRRNIHIIVESENSILQLLQPQPQVWILHPVFSGEATGVEVTNQLTDQNLPIIIQQCLQKEDPWCTPSPCSSPP